MYLEETLILPLNVFGFPPLASLKTLLVFSYEIQMLKGRITLLMRLFKPTSDNIY